MDNLPKIIRSSENPKNISLTLQGAMILAIIYLAKQAGIDISDNDDYIKIDILRTNISVECENIFKEFIIDNGYDYNKVMILTSLIYLNIASLHHYPYSKFLFYLGKYMLYNLVKNK